MSFKHKKIIIGTSVFISAALAVICFGCTEWSASTAPWPTTRLVTLSAAVFFGSIAFTLLAISVICKAHGEQQSSSSSQNTDEVLLKTQDKLKQLEEKLTDQERLVQVGLLTAGIAHEIKNPLNFVNNFASMSVELFEEFEKLVKDQSDKMDGKAKTEILDITEDLKSNTHKIIEHGRRAESIVMNMLSQARAEDNPEKELALINPIVEENINLAYHGLRAHDSNFNVKIERDLDENCGQIECFAQPIGRVILNIINNGMYAASLKSEFKENHNPVIKISTKGSTDKVTILIKDNGLGIPKEKLNDIFEPFFTTKPKGQGTGLGLSICHDIIVNDHGGTIEVVSKADQHTEFKITLPRKASTKESTL